MGRSFSDVFGSPMPPSASGGMLLWTCCALSRLCASYRKMDGLPVCQRVHAIHSSGLFNVEANQVIREESKTLAPLFSGLEAVAVSGRLSLLDPRFHDAI